MPDNLKEVDYGGYALAHWNVGTDSNGCDLAIRHTQETDGEHWRFSHVCTSPRSGRTYRIAPQLQIGHGHEVLSTEPLHIEASILCSDCGIHGWVREGRWVSVGVVS